MNPPAGITLKDQKQPPGSLVLVFSADQIVRTGTRDPILSLKGEPADPLTRAREIDLGVLPALVVSVVGKDP